MGDFGMYKINYSRVKTFWESKLESKNKNCNDMKKDWFLYFTALCTLWNRHVFLIYIAHLDIILIPDYKYPISFWFIDLTKAFDNVQHKNLFEPPVKIIYLWKIINLEYLLRTNCLYRNRKWIKQVQKKEKWT